MVVTVEELVEKLKLLPHPEGGFFAETFRDPGIIHQGHPAPKGPRSYSTAIYFLLPRGHFSSLHVIASSEVWHFYLGDPLTVVELDPDTGAKKETVLGTDFAAGQVPQHVVPAGTWFGAVPTADLAASYSGPIADGSNPNPPLKPHEFGFSLVGCTVAPGFDFTDFELGTRAELLEKFPGQKDTIERLARA